MIKECKICEKEFESKSKQQLYCSQYCQGQSKKKPKTCEHCGFIFMSKNSKARFCSNKCGAENRFKENNIKLVCEGCGESFTRIKSKIRSSTNFCSFACSQGEKKPTRFSSIEISCGYCSENFYRQPNAIREVNFCDHTCYSNYSAEYGLTRGENNGRYNGELSDEEREKGRNYSEYYAWRTRVFERDSFTCTCCGSRGGVLNAHHIRNYSTNKELRTALSNGTTLCKQCHDSFHKKYGRFNNDENQLNEFIRESS